MCVDSCICVGVASQHLRSEGIVFFSLSPMERIMLYIRCLCIGKWRLECVAGVTTNSPKNETGVSDHIKERPHEKLLKLEMQTTGGLGRICERQSVKLACAVLPFPLLCDRVRDDETLRRHAVEVYWSSLIRRGVCCRRRFRGLPDSHQELSCR